MLTLDKQADHILGLSSGETPTEKRHQGQRGRGKRSDDRPVFTAIDLIDRARRFEVPIGNAIQFAGLNRHGRAEFFDTE